MQRLSFWGLIINPYMPIMKHLAYIFVFLLSIGFGVCDRQQHSADIVPSESSDCYLSEPDTQLPCGLLGQTLYSLQGGRVESATPTHFSTNANRPSFGKNRSRTAFLRMMLHHYQSFYILFRGKVRLEAAPYTTHTCSAYYVFALQRLLC